MTYHPPTETNPPFTSPPTWPFSTSSADWEPDYRLRLLEAAIIYMWQGGTSGAAGCVAVATSAPPPNQSVIAPPEGFLWVNPSANPGDTSVVPLPAPVTTGTTTQSFTDGNGDIWVAKNGVRSGHWYRARDVLHSSVYRVAAFSITTGATTLPFDTIANDPYGIYVTGTGQFIAPVAGLYRVEYHLGGGGTASAWMNATAVYNAGTQVVYGQAHTSMTAFTTTIASITYKMNAGDAFIMQVSGSVALTGQPGIATTFGNFDYLGTG